MLLSKIKCSRARQIGNLFKWDFNNYFYYHIAHFNLLKFNADFAFYLYYCKSCIFAGYQTLNGTNITLYPAEPSGWVGGLTLQVMV